MTNFGYRGFDFLPRFQMVPVELSGQLFKLTAGLLYLFVPPCFVIFFLCTAEDPYDAVAFFSSFHFVGFILDDFAFLAGVHYFQGILPWDGLTSHTAVEL